MAKLFESHMKNDPNFEVPVKSQLGLVVFRLKVCYTNDLQIIMTVKLFICTIFFKGGEAQTK